jgi:hypothetical protein
MATTPSRAMPMVGAITTLAERLVTQDAARVNAARAASRLHQHRREVEDVARFMATHQHAWRPDNAGQTTRNPDRGQRTSRSP